MLIIAETSENCCEDGVKQQGPPRTVGSQEMCPSRSPSMGGQYGQADLADTCIEGIHCLAKW